MSYKSRREERYIRFDEEQSHRRTRAQNEAFIDLIQTNGAEGTWSFSSIPPEGGTVILQKVPYKQWMIERDGTITVQPYGTTPSDGL